jgi:hypothetical protein
LPEKRKINDRDMPFSLLARRIATLHSCIDVAVNDLGSWRRHGLCREYGSWGRHRLCREYGSS